MNNIVSKQITRILILSIKIKLLKRILLFVLFTTPVNALLLLFDNSYVMSKDFYIFNRLFKIYTVLRGKCSIKFAIKLSEINS